MFPLLKHFPLNLIYRVLSEKCRYQAENVHDYYIHYTLLEVNYHTRFYYIQ